MEADEDDETDLDADAAMAEVVASARFENDGSEAGDGEGGKVCRVPCGRGFAGHHSVACVLRAKARVQGLRLCCPVCAGSARPLSRCRELYVYRVFALDDVGGQGQVALDHARAVVTAGGRAPRCRPPRARGRPSSGGNSPSTTSERYANDTTARVHMLAAASEAHRCACT